MLKNFEKKFKPEKIFLIKTQNPCVATPKVKTNISILKDALNKNCALEFRANTKLQDCQRIIEKDNLGKKFF